MSFRVVLGTTVLLVGACGGSSNGPGKLPQAEQDAARALGRQRFETFVAQVGRRLASDHRLVTEVLESIAATNPDLFATAPDDPTLKTTPANGAAEPSPETGAKTGPSPWQDEVHG